MATSALKYTHYLLEEAVKKLFGKDEAVRIAEALVFGDSNKTAALNVP